jgi:alanyl-tRNA synthetase
MFDELAAEVKGSGGKIIPGEEAFRLYDTYGLPLELTREFSEDEGLEVDEEGFQKAMRQQREKARAAWKGSSAAVAGSVVEEMRKRAGEGGSTFLGYDQLVVGDAIVQAVLRDGEIVETLNPGDRGGVIVDRTPFYAESGGQIGDRGALRAAGVAGRITDTQRLPGGWILHLLELEDGSLRGGDTVELHVDEERRNRTIRNHTATHLLHAALREQLGGHVKQAGSLVAPDRLRFDFAHFGPVTDEEIEAIERRVNEAIRRDISTQIEQMDQAAALERGALAFFGEKYGDQVRVVSVPGVSMELCGGTHVQATGQIGAFFITHEESVAAGTRRIEAVTGRDAIEQSQHQRGVLRQVMSELHAGEADVPAQIESLMERLKTAEREVDRLRVKLASEQAGESLDAVAADIDGIKVVAREVEDLDSSAMRNLVDELKAKIGSGVVVLGIRRDGKAQLVVGVTADLTDRVSAVAVVRKLAAVVGGGGGGHSELAEAGGPRGDRLEEALQKAPETVAEQMG